MFICDIKGKVGNTSISYAYDMAGVRSSKTVNGTEYRYTTLSGLVTRQEMRGVHTLTSSERIWIFDNGWGG